MHFHPKMLETKFGNDEDYDKDVIEYYAPYYQFIVSICHAAIQHELVTPEVVGLCKLLPLDRKCSNDPSRFYGCRGKLTNELDHLSSVLGRVDGQLFGRTCNFYQSTLFQL